MARTCFNIYCTNQICTKLQNTFNIVRKDPQIEYGGPEKSLSNYELDRKWLEEFGGLIGLRVTDLMEIHNFSKKDLSIYDYPSQEELKQFPIKKYFFRLF